MYILGRYPSQDATLVYSGLPAGSYGVSAALEDGRVIAESHVKITGDGSEQTVRLQPRE